MNLCLIQEMKEHIINFIESKKEEAAALSTAIFEHPEVAGHEVFSSDALCQFLKNNGFAIEKGLGSQATAFRASYGTEGLCIGFLAEYDALDGLQQSPQPKRDGNGGPGHGCGHNLLGVGSCMAAAALKEALVKSGIPGRIVVYGTPGHHWTTTACAGSAMAHKGLLFAAKVLACTALDCITIPGLYEEVRRAFENTD